MELYQNDSHCTPRVCSRTSLSRAAVGFSSPFREIATRRAKRKVVKYWYAWRKLIRNPNTYSSTSVSSRPPSPSGGKVQMPTIVAGSITILSDAGLGMAMFSLGLFMALQPRIIACGNKKPAYAMAVRFFCGPAVMTAASFAIGLKGTLLPITIVQAALPEGIVPSSLPRSTTCIPTFSAQGSYLECSFLCLLP